MKKIVLVLCWLMLSIGMQANNYDKLAQYLIPMPRELSMKSNELSEIEAARYIDNLSSLLCVDVDGACNLKGELRLYMQVDTVLVVADGYKLNIDRSRITITAGNRAGLFYAKQTLLQIFAYAIDNGGLLPMLKIADSPDFARRGYMLDISRNKVPTMATLKQIIDLVAMLKINELQLYTEHTFAYKNHSVVWLDASPLTPNDIRILDKYCRERFIDLVPNQNSFGHMEQWLEHDEYLDLCECPDDCNTIWGKRKRTSLDPLNPKSLQLMSELYAELIPNFSSDYINIGCDETVELGQGRSKTMCDSLGKGRVYLNFLKQLNDEVHRNGKYAQFWGDIVLNHPELISEIPKDMTAMVWGYTTDYPFQKNLPRFRDAGLDFYVCPGTSAWCSLLGRNPDAFENIRLAAKYGKHYGAKGMMITDWGDYGHWQPLSVSIPAIMVGAAYAWNQDKNPAKHIEFQLNRYIFDDVEGNTAKALMALSETFREANIPEGNASVFHLMLHRYRWTMKGQYQTKKLTTKSLSNTEQAVRSALDILHQSNPQCADSAIVIAELQLAADMALHSLHLGMARLSAPEYATANISAAKKAELIAELTPIIERYRQLWTVRNCRGGLDESAQKLEDVLNYYKGN